MENSFEIKNFECEDELINQAGVYKILKNNFVKDSEVIYVGKTKNIKERFKDRLILRLSYIEIDFLVIDDKNKRDNIENRLIRRFKPELNKSFPCKFSNSIKDNSFSLSSDELNILSNLYFGDLVNESDYFSWKIAKNFVDLSKTTLIEIFDNLVDKDFLVKDNSFGNIYTLKLTNIDSNKRYIAKELGFYNNLLKNDGVDK